MQAVATTAPAGYVHHCKTICEFIPFSRLKYRLPNLKIAASLRSENLGGKIRNCCITAIPGICPTCGQENHRPIYCGDHTNCPICARSLAISEGNKVFRRLMELGTDYIAHLVLTVPHEPEQATWDSEERENFAKILFRMANAFLGRINCRGAAVVIHTWSSQAPLSQPHWHVHILYPAKRAWEPVKAWATIWREILQGAQIYCPPQGVDLFYRFAPRSRTQQVRHWCNYAVRRAILDINKALLAGATLDLDAYIYHVLWRPYFRRLRWVGDLQDRSVGRFLDVVALREKIATDALAWRQKACRNCGQPISFAKWGMRTNLDQEKVALVCDSWSLY